MVFREIDCFHVGESPETTVLLSRFWFGWLSPERVTNSRLCGVSRCNTLKILPFASLFPVNDTETGPLQTVDISDPDVTKWTLSDLEPLTKYKFYLRSCTTVGCGPVASEESTTTLKSSK